MTDLVEKQQMTPNTDNYESKFLAFNGWLDAIRNAINEDDEAWKKAVNESLDDGFKNWLVSLSDERKEELKNKIREVLDKIKEQNPRFNQNDFSSLTALAQSLQIQWYTNTSENSNNQGAVTATEQTSGLWLTGTLWSIDILQTWKQTTGKFYWDINKPTQNGAQSADNEWNPTENWDQQQESQKQSELDKTNNNINDHIDSIKSLLGSDKIKKLHETQDPKKSLTETQTLLENFQKIIKNPSKKNVNELQKYIYNNLSWESKSKFASENHIKGNNDNINFDGQFGTSTLTWLNTVLGNINTYLKSLQPEKNEWAEENPLKDVEVKKSIDLLEWDTQIDATDLLDGTLPDGAKAEFKGGKWINKWGTKPQEVTVVVKDQNNKELGEIIIIATVDTTNNKVGLKRKETWNPTTSTASANPEATKSTAPEKITVNREVHSIATEPPADKFKWWTLYCLNAWATENQEAQNNTLDINGDREYLMKMGENVYKVKIDQNWNLCPTAINMISNVPVVMKNSTSGKVYIENKLPPVLKGKCIIWWDWDDYTIALPWWWKKLTIEPMTIDWKWIWSLTDSLAFLNLTNYLRNSWKMNDIEFKNDNPDLKLEWNELYVRVKKTRDVNWKKVKWLKVNKYDFWLTDKEELLTKFIKYNNGEKWEDDWDRKKPNKYYSKINFRWEAQLQVAWWSSQAPNSPFAGVNVHSQHRSAAETSIQWSSNVTLTSQSPKNQVGEEMDNENNQIEDAIVISTIFKPKNPIFWWDEKNQWDVIDDNNAQFDWIWVFNNGNFEFEKHIANQNGVISIWNDSFEKLEYIKDEGWQRLSKENFSWKWYMIGKYKFMNWKEEWRDVWYISVWNYKDWLMDWEWKRFFETGSKYEWNWKEGRENWQWKYTYANWDIYEWGFKDGKFEWEWKFIFKSWITITWKFENNNFVSWKLKHGDVAYDIEKDDKWLKITSEWSNNWQYITFNDWHLNIENSKVMIA